MASSSMSADMSSVPSSGEVSLSSTKNGVSQPMLEGAHNTHAASSSQWSPNSILTHSSSAMDGPSHNQPSHSESELTPFPNSRLAGRPPKVLPTTTTTTSLPFETAILPHTRPHIYNNQREYVRSTLNPSISSSTPRFDAQHSLEPSVSPYLSDHVLNNSSSTRLRTSNQVFVSTTDLAAHYGIPTALPPAPSTAPHRTNSVPHSSEQLLDFQTISKNYINMLAQKSSDSNPSDVEMSNQTVSPADLQKPVASEFPSDVQGLIDSIVDQSVMESPFGDNFLTSPLTPSLDNFGGSPTDTPYEEFLQTPLIVDNSMFVSSGFDPNQPLFNDPIYHDSSSNEKASESSSQMQNFDPSQLLTFSPSNPAIDTPSLDPASLVSHPHTSENTTFHSVEKASSSMVSSTSVSMTPSSPMLGARRRVSATGTRKNLKPEALVPVDAPTQPRRYITPSATSRKDVPTAFARKRARRMGLDGEDELSEQNVNLDPVELQQIESKRRSNTEAARRSRQRKLLYQRELEEKVASLTTDRDKWKERANMCLSMLRKHGVMFSFDE